MPMCSASAAQAVPSINRSGKQPQPLIVSTNWLIAVPSVNRARASPATLSWSVLPSTLPSRASTAQASPATCRPSRSQASTITGKSCHKSDASGLHAIGHVPSVNHSGKSCHVPRGYPFRLPDCESQASTTQASSAPSRSGPSFEERVLSSRASTAQASPAHRLLHEYAGARVLYVPTVTDWQVPSVKPLGQVRLDAIVPRVNHAGKACHSPSHAVPSVNHSGKSCHDRRYGQRPHLGAPRPARQPRGQVLPLSSLQAALCSVRPERQPLGQVLRDICTWDDIDLEHPMPRASTAWASPTTCPMVHVVGPRTHPERQALSRDRRSGPERQPRGQTCLLCCAHVFIRTAFAVGRLRVPNVNRSGKS